MRNILSLPMAIFLLLCAYGLFVWFNPETQKSCDFLTKGVDRVLALE